MRPMSPFCFGKYRNPLTEYVLPRLICSSCGGCAGVPDHRAFHCVAAWPSNALVAAQLHPAVS